MNFASSAVSMWSPKRPERNPLQDNGEPNMILRDLPAKAFQDQHPCPLGLPAILTVVHMPTVMFSQAELCSVHVQPAEIKVSRPGPGDANLST